MNRHKMAQPKRLVYYRSRTLMEAVFWPDKASSHYACARQTTTYLNNKNINCVPKELNPTEVPYFRSIADFIVALANYICVLGG